MNRLLLLLLLPVSLFAQRFSSAEINRFEQQAKRVTIIRDNWGIPHIYGKTDADVVFGLLYAQCEDDFKRVEMNYIEKLGRMAELKGESELYNDLQIKLLIDTTEAIADYNKAAPWLKKLMNAYADGINYYLHKHPQVKPAMLTRFKPWYTLLWTDGSIGAISTADATIAELKNFYSGDKVTYLDAPKDPENQTGSNGFAVGPSKTASGNAILYINPHVTFYFRPEVHVVSEEGLNVYGAVTWGQFFVYQGFNPYCGWMHTSSAVDVSDLYAEKITQKGNLYFYQYNGRLKPVSEKKITIKYQKDGQLLSRTFTTYATHHGPVIAKRNDQWLSLRSYNRSMLSLVQSWQRTKAKGLEDYKKVMDLKANTSNNTVFADNKGNIAYWHGNYVPVRDPRLNWAKPVDGSTSATEWKGLHAVSETVHLYNPANGWLQNCNSTPFTVAGVNSPDKAAYPPYMAPDGENFRGVNAARVLSKGKDFTVDKMIEAGYDNYLSAFEVLVPALVKSFETNVKPVDSLYSQLAEPIALLKKWDYRTATSSVPTTWAIEWAQRLNGAIQKIYIDQGEDDQVTRTKKFAEVATADQLVIPFAQTLADLQKRFGTWQKPWGDINRFQRLAGDIQGKYDDAQPSLPMGYASALWGMLPSYNSRVYQGTQKRYGISGNSFICAVEFGPRIKARSLLAGGQSGDPASAHFKDQAEMYTKGQFKDVLFYKEDVLKHAEKMYHPGE
ncbi:penicillin acylase family protein [Emticicia sp. 21SJ11W-3]|uniref:penicillin acylase family protein n=1 Tax=Emticicia sp. 21SJ11W-3 TaxID=2916755 RepID=UPI00209EC2F1|nr:penicillin acylase family protein [Emticicia sp. 21SJ11W-3]UTA66856.1 penicillin acylase family protein [Emticicia sp. 21SJ11W-3]